jgi:hypothetical protein
MAELTHGLRKLGGGCLGRVHGFLGVGQGHGVQLREALDDGQAPSWDIARKKFFFTPTPFLFS